MLEQLSRNFRPACLGHPRPQPLVRDIPARWFLGVAFTMVTVLSAGGCGRRGPAVELVKGRLRLDGEPLGGASVGFLPVGPGQGLHAVGMTEADGSFRLTTLPDGKANAGAALGNYKVIVSKIIRVDPKEPSPPATPRPGASYPKRVQIGGWQPDSIIVVPDDYGMAETSGLTATVKPGPNEVMFELRSDYAAPRGGPRAE
jgi:hypothetical protein